MVSKVISAESAEFSRWDLPDVDEAGARAAAAKGGQGHSVRELDELQKAAYEEAFAKGREEGLAAGREAGREAGYQEGIAAAREQAQRLAGVLDALAEPVGQLDDEAEQELMHLVFQVAQQVIRREIQTQPGEVMAVLREAMAVLPMSAREVTVRLHPDDAAFVRESWGDEEQGGSWRVAEDHGVSRGGCVVQSASSRIDATLEKRITALAAQLLGGDRAGDEEADAEGDEP